MVPHVLAATAATAAALLLSTSLLAAPAATAAGAPPAQGFQEATSVVAVEVPVTVVRGGQPVRGLTAADFELYDGRRKQAITGFEVVDLAAPRSRPASPAGPAAVPLAGRRHFLLFFDLSYSEPSSVVKARQAATAFIARGIDPSDLVAVATYSTAEGPHLALGFTSDRRQMEYAIETLGLPKLGERNPDQLGLLLSPNAGPGGHNPMLEGSRKKEGKDAFLLELLLALARQEAAGTRQGQKNDVGAMTRSLSDLAGLMAGVEGRKYVVYLSQGFDSGLLRGTTDEKTVKDIAQSAADDRSQVDSSLRFGDTKTSSEIERMLDAFRRADCVIESVDIGGIRAGGDQNAHNNAGEDTLFLLARDTGGELFRNTNDLSSAMASLLARTSVTYVLSFQPRELGAAGSYHELRVRLRGGQAGRGARVVSRPGYYAPRPYLARSPLERQLATGDLVLGGAPGGRIATAVLATPLPAVGGASDVPGDVPGRVAANALAFVPVLVEIDGPALLAGATETAQADVYVYAFDEQGTIHDHFGQVLELDLAKVRGTLERGGVKLYGRLDLAPGRYVLRVLVRNGITGETGLRVEPLTVPAFEKGERALLPPLVADATGRWLNLRAGGREQERPAPFPFTAGGRPFLPAARPVVAPGAEMPLLLMGSGWRVGGEEAGDLAALSLTGQVLGVDGKPRREGAVALRAANGAGADLADRGESNGRIDRLLAIFRPGSLPAGDYTLVVTLTDPATRQALSSSLPFAVAAEAPARPPATAPPIQADPPRP